MSRRKQIRWEKDRPLFLKVGLVVSLSLVILAFNWTVEPSVRGIPDEEHYELPSIEVIPNTRQEERLPPPPPPPSSDPIIVPEPVAPAGPKDPILPTPIVPRPGPGTINPEPVEPPPPLPVSKVEEPDVPPVIVEEMPRFPGCEELPTRAEKEECAMVALLEFLQKEVRYPDIARNAGIEGTVVIRFIVEKDGSLTAAEIIRDPGAGCGKEALRAVNSMPNWIPGRQQGRPVRVMFNLPVRFQLK